MSLSRRDLKVDSPAVPFDPERLARALRESCPEIQFALVLGSARDGGVPPGGDLDLAVSTGRGISLDLADRITNAAAEVVPGVEVDLGNFDRAEPVYRFEALKGRLLFARDLDRYLGAFSLACREYESQMHDYRRQTRYRLDRARMATR